MSIIFTHPNGWVLSHEEYLRSTYSKVRLKDTVQDFTFDEYFNLYCSFSRGKAPSIKTNKNKRNTTLSDEVASVNQLFQSIMNSLSRKELFKKADKESEEVVSNDDSRLIAHKYFESIQNVGKINGGNTNDYPITAKIDANFYIFPPKCVFFNNNISTLKSHLRTSQYDFILLDPPWYNRFVKRRKKFHPEHGYIFLDNNELSQIPIQELLSDDGLVAVWTTNSSSHIETVKNVLFPSWGVSWISTWFWIKVTKNGELIVPFSNDDVKQPYERLMFGCKTDRKHHNPEDSKCIISVPSSVHSHKPPIADVIREYIPKESNCLEIFARYLLPNWTSFGNQVLSLQLQSLFNSHISSST